MINLRSELHRALLEYYFTNQDAEHYLRELSRMLSLDAANLSRELDKLTKLGIFVARDNGREKFFRLNRKNPLFDNLKSLVLNMLDSDEKLSVQIKAKTKSRLS